MELTIDDSLLQQGISISAARHRLQQAELDGDMIDRIGALADLAAAQAEAGKLDDALTDFDRAISSAQEHGDHHQAAMSCVRKAALLVQTHRLDEGLEGLNLALQFASAAQDLALEREVRVRKALTLGRMGRAPEAIELLDGVLAALGAGLDQQQPRLLGLKGDLLQASGQEAAAQRAFEQAIDIAETKEAISLRIGLGRALIGQSKFESAAEVLGKALDEAQAAKEGKLEGGVLKALVQVDLALGRLDDLLQHSQLAQARAERAEDHVEASIQRGNVISAMFGLGRFERALTAILESIEYVRRRGPRAREILLQIQLGRVYYELHRHGEAESAYKAALQLAEQYNDLRSTAVALGRLGALYGEQGDLQAARRYGELGLEKVDQQVDPEIAAEQQVLMALTYRDLNELELAAAACHKAIALYQQLGDQAFAAQADSLLAELA